MGSAEGRATLQGVGLDLGTRTGQRVSRSRICPSI